MHYIIGIDEVGRAAKRRLPRLIQSRTRPGASPTRFVIGIDEVGRGSLAGPVVVAAVAAPRNFQFSPYQSKALPARQVGTGQAISNFQTKIRDSKRLTPRQRERWFEYFRKHPAVAYEVAWVYPRQIEKMNISRAANLAALRAFRRLIVTCHLSLVACRVCLDGGLYLGNMKNDNDGFVNIRVHPRRNLRLSARTVVRGDEKIKAVAAASIVAKVSRDRAMVRLAKKYPRYGFEVHKGYGTSAHRRAIRRLGISPVHRRTFCEHLTL